MLFSSLISTSSFCVFQSNRESLLSSFVLLLPWCFFRCIQSILLPQLPFCQFLRQCPPRRKRHCLDRSLCLTQMLLLFPLFRVTMFFLVFRVLIVFLWPLIDVLLSSDFSDWIMRRSIFRCADLIILSWSFECVHVPEAQVSVGVITMLNRCILWHRR